MAEVVVPWGGLITLWDLSIQPKSPAAADTGGCTANPALTTQDYSGVLLHSIYAAHSAPLKHAKGLAHVQLFLFCFVWYMSVWR